MASHLRSLSLLFACTLAACSNMGWAPGHTPSAPVVTAAPAATAPDTVTLRLAEAAEKAAKSLNTISGIQQVQYGTPEPDDFDRAPPELTEPVTISWVGPVEQFLQMMAARAGYKFTVIGARPPAPVTVTVDEYQQPLIKLMKSAALQVTGRADVVLDANRHVVEVRYAPVDGY